MIILCAALIRSELISELEFIYVPRPDWFFYKVDASMADKIKLGVQKKVVKSTFVKRAYHSCSVIGNTIYVYGGLSEGKIVLNEMHVYDVSTNNWNLVEPKRTGANTAIHRSAVPFPAWRLCQAHSLSHHTANVITNRFILVVGGWNGHKRTADVYCFDTNESTWFCIPVSGDIPVGLSSHTSVVISSTETLIIGREGGVRTQRRFSGAFKLNFETGKYIEAPFHTSSRSGHTANFINVRGNKDTSLIILGGRKSGGYEIVGSVQTFNSQTGTFANENMVSLVRHCCVCEEPSGRQHLQAIELNSRYLLFYGGETWSGVRNNVTNEVFILGTYRMKWYQVPVDDQTPRLVGHSACIIGEKILVVGGMLENKPTDTLWEMMLC